MLPVYSLDGADVAFRRHFGEWTGTLNVAYGGAESDFPDGGVKSEGLWNANVTFVRGRFTSRLAVAGATLRMDFLEELFDGFRAFGPEGQTIADRYDVDRRSFQFATAGVEFDPGAWLTIAEVAWLDTHSAFGERVAGHVTVGIRRGAFTPYAAYSRTDRLSESSAAGLSSTGLPEESAQPAAALNAGLNGVLASTAVQQTLTLGARWDYALGFALKGQIEFIDLMDNSTGHFINTRPEFEPGGSARLISIATVFVF